MLPLDDDRWSTLHHAYGAATDIPATLAALKASPATEDHDLWEVFWSALVHQGDVYTATFAAVPHVVEVIVNHPGEVSWQAFAFVASVEIDRAAVSYLIPPDLVADYAIALGRIPSIVGRIFIEPRGELHTRCAMAALAASQHQVGLAEVILEAEPEAIPTMLTWWHER